MNKKHILINSEKLKISNGRKWLMLVLIYFLSLIVISIVENLVSNISHINIAKMEQVTFYIRGFIILSFIHDLAPRFKKTISILWSALAVFTYLGIDSKAGDKLYLGTFVFLIAIIVYNIFLYKKTSDLNSKGI